MQGGVLELQKEITLQEELQKLIKSQELRDMIRINQQMSPQKKLKVTF